MLNKSVHPPQNVSWGSKYDKKQCVLNIHGTSKHIDIHNIYVLLSGKNCYDNFSTM